MTELPGVPRRLVTTQQPQTRISPADVAAPSIAIGRALEQGGDALLKITTDYQSAVDTTTVSRHLDEAQTNALKLSTAANGDTTIFKKSWDAYTRETLKQVPKKYQGEFANKLIQIGGTNERQIFAAAAERTGKIALNAIDARIGTLTDQMTDLARNGQADSPDYKSHSVELDDLIQQKTQNQLIAYSPEQAAADRARNQDTFVGATVSGDLERTYAKDGYQAAQKQAQAIYESADDGLDKVQKLKAIQAGLKSVRSLYEADSQTRKQFSADRQEVTAALADGSIDPDNALITDMLATADQLNDPVSRLSLISAQAKARLNPMASMPLSGRLDYLARLRGAESGGNVNATNPSSSALGPDQFIDSTWLDVVKRNRPDLAAGKSDADLLAMRTDPKLSGEMTTALAKENNAALAAKGIAATPENTYLAHFLGAGGAVAILSAPPDTPVSQLLGADAIAANKAVLDGKTAGEVRGWAARKMGNENGSSDEPSPEAILARNQEYVKPGEHTYNTHLDVPTEKKFRQWVADNNVPFDPNAKVSDYDMRGFYIALQRGDPLAKNAVDPNDGKMHYPDYWKTPYHQTFSNESQWAAPNAPHWTTDDKLVDSSGKVLFDDRQNAAPDTAMSSTAAGLDDYTRGVLPAVKARISEGLTDAIAGAKVALDHDHPLDDGQMQDLVEAARIVDKAGAYDDVRDIFARSAAVSTALGLSVSDQAAFIDQLRAPGPVGDEALRMTALDQAVATNKRMADLLDKDPRALGVQLGLFKDGPPVDFTNAADAPAILAARVPEMQRLAGAEKTGPLSVLRPDEAKALNATWNGANANQKLALVAGLAGSLPGDTLMATLAQFAGKDDTRSLAVAGALASTNPEAGAAVIRGSEALKTNQKFAFDNGASEYLDARDKVFPPTTVAPAMEAAWQGHLDAALAAYADASARAGDSSGKFDETRWTAAVNLVTGGILEQGNGKIIAPRPDIDQSRFDAVMAGLPEAAFSGAATPDGTPLTGRFIRSQGTLQSYGDGRYVIELGGTGAYALRSARGPSEAGIGGPFVLDLRPWLDYSPSPTGKGAASMEAAHRMNSQIGKLGIFGF